MRGFKPLHLRRRCGTWMGHQFTNGFELWSCWGWASPVQSSAILVQKFLLHFRRGRGPVHQWITYMKQNAYRNQRFCFNSTVVAISDLPATLFNRSNFCWDPVSPFAWRG